MVNVWSLCILPFSVGASISNWEDVGFDLAYTSRTVNLHVNGTNTGCTISSTVIGMKCKDRKGGGVSQPSNAFQSLVDCQHMGEEFDLLAVKPDESCWKFTVTQQVQRDQVISADRLEIRPGQVANVTCVLSPFGPDNEGSDPSSGFTTKTTAKLELTARNAGTDASGTKTYPIGAVKFLQKDEEVPARFKK